MSGMRYLANFLDLVNSQILEKIYYLLSLLYYPSLVPYYSLSFIPTDKGAYHPSPKVFLTTNGNHNRKPQLDPMQSSGNCR